MLGDSGKATGRQEPVLCWTVREGGTLMMAYLSAYLDSKGIKVELELFSEKSHSYHFCGIRIALSVSSSEPCLCSVGNIRA